MADELSKLMKTVLADAAKRPDGRVPFSLPYPSTYKALVRRGLMTWRPLAITEAGRAALSKAGA